MPLSNRTIEFINNRMPRNATMPSALGVGLVGWGRAERMQDPVWHVPSQVPGSTPKGAKHPRRDDVDAVERDFLSASPHLFKLIG